MTAALKKYRLGSKPEEFLLSADYLGGTPVGHEDWHALIFDEDQFTLRPRPFVFALQSPDGQETVTMVLHQTISKDAFPLPFFGEERAKDWHRFAIVSLADDQPWALFIIPLH